MGVTTYTQEDACSVAPSRMFKALILDSHNLIPKIAPQSIKSIEFVHGDGGVGSIKQTNFPDAAPFKYVKHRIDALDTANFSSKYTVIEGDVLGDKLDSITYEAKIEAGPGGGSVCKLTSYYHTKGDIEIKPEELKAGKDKATEMFKKVEEHLLAHPQLYA
ncbi:major strawberry allergen Fra a 1-3-like [Cornus florida]|uniref:major strawberry allergen Fra a 1-3-like n=1 Tax=Cornus florida TaxID=4283 RepID=UPI002899E7BA|nr:major strawberry allergen Fra a 1-3-like [Cornus florida]